MNKTDLKKLILEVIEEERNTTQGLLGKGGTTAFGSPTNVSGKVIVTNRTERELYVNLIVNEGWIRLHLEEGAKNANEPRLPLVNSGQGSSNGFSGVENPSVNPAQAIK